VHKNTESPSRRSPEDLRPERDPMVIAALEEGRHADDIWIVECPNCCIYSYWNEGTHASCRKCGLDLSAITGDALTLEDYWSQAEYPGDES
jgi:hypothetical protein